MCTREDLIISYSHSHTTHDYLTILTLFSHDLDCLIVSLSTSREEREYRDECEYPEHMDPILGENLESKVEKQRKYLQ